MVKRLFFYAFLCLSLPSFAQSDAYKARKIKQLAERSPFQDDIDGKFPERILYQDEDVLAFKDIRPQLPVHFLVIPRKRIPTINDLTEADGKIIVKMVMVAKKLAKDFGIDETGYRLALNTNENSGQSVFHIHLHVLGGYKTGAMVEQTWRNQTDKPSAAYLKDIENVKKAFADYAAAWLKNDADAVMATLTKDAVVMPQGVSPKKGIGDIKQFWFPTDGSRTTVTKFDGLIEDIKIDLTTAFVRSSAVLSFEYEKNGQKIIKNDQKQVYTTFFERQSDGQWKVTCKMWHDIN